MNMKEKDIINFLSKLSDSLRSCSNDIDLFLNSNNFTNLAELLHSNSWPKAVQEDQICDFSSCEQKFFRAENCLNVFGLSKQKLFNKRFLDFGCGEGHVAVEASRRGAKSFGYDIYANDSWKSFDNVTFFNDWLTVEREVKANGKFDYILVYDVFDHAKNEDIQSLISKIYDVSCGLVFVRTHPFFSRHGCHLHYKLNKAFVHLAFTLEELAALNIFAIDSIIYTHDVSDYSKAFSKKFNVLNEHRIIDPVDDFFNNNFFILKRIKDKFFRNAEQETFLNNISCSFVDFVLKPIEPFIL